jgi:hypothetical protein
LNLKELQRIVEDSCFIEDENEFDVMLDFYHDLGLIVKHGSTVVLEAQWLIDVFKQLITIPCFKDMVRNRKLEMSMLLFCTFSLFTPLKELL